MPDTCHDSAAVRCSRRDLIAGLLLVGLGIVTTGGFLAAPFDLHLPRCSEPYDAAIYPWNFRWFHDSWFAQDGSLLFTQRFFYPDGEGLALYTPTYFYGAMSLIFQWFLSPAQALPLAVAFFLCCSTILTGILTYVLARRLGVQAAGSLLAAALFMLASGRMMNAARLNLFCTEFLLLFLLLGCWFWQRGGFARALAFGLSGAALLFQSQPLFFQGALAVTVVAAVWLATAAWRPFRRGLDSANGGPTLRSRWRPGLAAAGVWLLVSAPFLWAMLQELSDSPALTQSDIMLQVPDSSLDLLSLVTPTRADIFYGAKLAARRVSFFEGQEGAAAHRAAVSFFLGFGWLFFLAVATIRCHWRRWLPFAVFAAVLFAIALGPVPRLAGQPLPLPSAYELLSFVPLVKLSKSPVRLILLIQLALAVWAGLGVERWAAKGKKPLWAAGVSLLMTFAVAEQWDTLPLGSIEPRRRIPDAMEQIDREPGHAAVLDLPFDGLPFKTHRTDAVAMALGAVHGKPIFFGLYPRASRSNLKSTLAQTVLAATLEQAGTAATSPAVFELGTRQSTRILEELSDLNVGHVLVHDLIDSPTTMKTHVAHLLTMMRSMPGITETPLSLGPGYDLYWFRLFPP